MVYRFRAITNNYTTYGIEQNPRLSRWRLKDDGFRKLGRAAPHCHVSLRPPRMAPPPPTLAP